MCAVGGGKLKHIAAKIVAAIATATLGAWLQFVVYRSQLAVGDGAQLALAVGDVEAALHGLAVVGGDAGGGVGHYDGVGMQGEFVAVRGHKVAQGVALVGVACEGFCEVVHVDASGGAIKVGTCAQVGGENGWHGIAVASHGWHEGHAAGLHQLCVVQCYLFGIGGVDLPRDDAAEVGAVDAVVDGLARAAANLAAQIVKIEFELVCVAPPRIAVAIIGVEGELAAEVVVVAVFAIIVVVAAKVEGVGGVKTGVEEVFGV